MNTESLATLDRLVADTGGRGNEGEEVGDAIRQALRDARTSYQVGYEEPFSKWDGKLHKLRVWTNRKSVHIQTQANYLADRDSAGVDFSRVINSAATPPFDTAEIGLHGVLARDPNKAGTAHLRVLVNARDLALIHQNNRYIGG